MRRQLFLTTLRPKPRRMLIARSVEIKAWEHATLEEIIQFQFVQSTGSLLPTLFSNKSFTRLYSWNFPAYRNNHIVKNRIEFVLIKTHLLGQSVQSHILKYADDAVVFTMMDQNIYPNGPDVALYHPIFETKIQVIFC